MGGFTLTAGLSDLSQGGALDGLLARLTDLSPALDNAGGFVVASVMENFAAQGRPEAWKPLAESTVQRKGHSTILFETGRLMSSIGYRAAANLLTVTASVPYARVQQQGGNAGVGGMARIPARPFLLIQQADADAIASVVGEYLSGSGVA